METEPNPMMPLIKSAMQAVDAACMLANYVPTKRERVQMCLKYSIEYLIGLHKKQPDDAGGPMKINVNWGPNG